MQLAIINATLVAVGDAYRNTHGKTLQKIVVDVEEIVRVATESMKRCHM